MAGMRIRGGRVWVGLLAALVIVGLMAPVAHAQRGQGGPGGQQQQSREVPLPEKIAAPESWINALRWRSIGPANMSGRIIDLAVYEKDPTIWWAATASGGLLKTTNDGFTFEHQFDREATVSLGAVDVFQGDPNIIWVGTGEENPRNSSSYGDGVYKSTDGGKSWTNMGLKEIFQTGAVCIHPTNPDIVYIGALGRLWGTNEERGLFKTTDGGKTWEKILYIDEKTGVMDVVMHPTEPETLLVATFERQRDAFDGNDPVKGWGPGSGIYRTTDGGKTFEKITKGLPTIDIGRIGLNYYRKDPNIVYAVIQTAWTGAQSAKVAFLGASGENADAGARLTNISDDGPAQKAGLQSGDIVLEFDEKKILSYRDLLGEVRKKQVDDEATLTIARSGEVHEIAVKFGKRPEIEDPEDAEPSRQGSPFAGSLGGQEPNLQDEQGADGFQYGGIFRSTDAGISWERINSLNPRPMYFSKIRVDPSDNNYIYVLGIPLYRSSDGGQTFTADGHGSEVHVDHHAMWVDHRDGRHIILGNDGGIYVTRDRMSSWDHLNHVAIGQFYHVGVSPEANYRVAGGLQDNGTWAGPTLARNDRGPINTDWFRVGGGDGFVTFFDPDEPDRIYFESQNGGMGRMHISSGERGSIRPRAPRGVQYRFNWKTPYLLSQYNSRVYYTAGNYVFRSIDRGNDLQPISPEITRTEQGSGSAFGESRFDQNTLYAGTTDGALVMTADGGETWIDLWTGEALQPRGERDEQAAGGNDRRAPRAEGGGGREAAMDSLIGTWQIRLLGEGIPPDSSEISLTLERGERGVLRGSARSNALEGTVESVRYQPEQSEVRIVVNSNLGRMEFTGRVDGSTMSGTVLAGGGMLNIRFSARKGGGDLHAEAWDPEREEIASSPGGEELLAVRQQDGDDVVAGVWAGRIVSDEIPPGAAAFSFTLNRAGTTLTGSVESQAGGGAITEGTFNVETGEVRFSVSSPQGPIGFAGRLANGRITGQLIAGGGAFSIPFEATLTRAFAADTAASRPTQERATTPSRRPARATNETQQASPDDGRPKPIGQLLPKPMWVSALEPSRHVRGRLYMSIDGHRSDDDACYAFASEDDGRTWRLLTKDLPRGSARVIREDLLNPDVLYLGTEFAVWISIDRGQTWTKFNSNLPTVAVHEFAQHPTRGEVVAGTHGRSLWILDLTPVRQFTKKALTERATLLRPNTAIKWITLPARANAGTRQFVGENPPTSAMIYYALTSNAAEVTVRIEDITGRLIREFEGNSSPGLHLVEWDLRRQLRGNQSGRFRRGPLVEAGSYRVVLQVDDDTFVQPLMVIDDPEYQSIPLDATGALRIEETMDQESFEEQFGDAEERQGARRDDDRESS